MGRRVLPQVFLVGETRIVREEYDAFLSAVGHPGWCTDASSDAEELIEAYGRGCYRSWAPGDNPNVTRVREGNQRYLANIQHVGHGSVAEHVVVNFQFVNVSRVFTHELVRHRAGTAMSQESLRFVRLADLDYWLPADLDNDPQVNAEVAEVVEFLERKQRRWAQHFGLDEPGTGFDFKKRVTSALRRLAPIGLATRIGWSANFRTLAHVVNLRTAPSAEEEIRLVFGIVAQKLFARYPGFFRWDPELARTGHYVLAENPRI